MRGPLVPDGPRLKLEIVDLRAAGMEVDLLSKVALQVLLDPMVDLSGLPAPNQISRARVAGEALVTVASGVSSLTSSMTASR